jgi:hypothetical protein
VSSGAIVAGAGCKRVTTGEGGTPLIRPVEPGKLAGRLPSVAEPKRRSGSSGVLTVSFFVLTSCRKPVKTQAKSPTDSHSVLVDGATFEA